MAAWHQEYLVEPTEDLLASVPVGSEMRELERCQQLGYGIESLFLSEVAAQYTGWPPESTTDGSSVDLCIRTGLGSLDVVGRMWIDFSGEVFPFRAEIRRTSDGTVSVVGSIGQVHERTGQPPRLPRGTLIVPVRDENEQNPVPELIIGRRQVPIVWTTVLEWPDDP